MLFSSYSLIINNISPFLSSDDGVNVSSADTAVGVSGGDVIRYITDVDTECTTTVLLPPTGRLT